MNFIDNLEIKNFKSIRHQKIEGCKKINVFIGYPNVGKSNILEAISALQFCKSNKGSFHDFCRFENVAELFFEANINESAIISYNNNCSVNIKYGNEGNVEFFTSRYGSDGEVNGIGYEPSTIEIDVFKYLFQLNNSKKNIYTLKNLQSPFGENLFLLIGKDKNLRKDLNLLLADYNIRLLIDKVSNSLRLIKEINEDSIFQLSYSLLADTLQRLFFYKAAIYSNRNSVLIFEEPEANMFPPYIKKLTTDILFDKTNQFFLATHSPYVLDELILEAGEDLSVYLVDYKDGETIIHHLSREDLSEIRQYGVDLFFNIESYLKHGQVNNS
jgi:AAA15 family ATPase/GTPase